MSVERLLRDVFVLLDACFSATDAEDIDTLADTLVERLTTSLGAITGLLLVRLDDQGTVRAFPEHRRALLGPLGDPITRFRRGIDLGGPTVTQDPAQAHGFVATLSVPAPPDALLELHTRDLGSFDGRTMQVVGSLAPWIATQVRAASRELRARQDADRLHGAHAALDVLVNALPGVVWRFDARGRASFVSARATELLGLTGPHTDDTHPRDRGLSATDTTRVRDEIEAATRAHLPEITLSYRYTHGRARHRLDLEERVAFAYDTSGALASVTGFVTDVTAARAAHRRMEELSAQRTADARADALRVDAARASRAKSEFLNLLSHELRAPLFPIIALSDLLLRTDDARVQPHEWREQVRMINGAGKQMLQLVGDLLDISRVDAGRARPNPGPIALTHFISALRDRAAERARVRDTQLDITLESGAHGSDVYTDRSVLERVASALIAHAIESLDSREVKVLVTAAPTSVLIHLSARAAPPAELPEHEEDIFDPFWERPAEARAESRGQGLALTLARRLAIAFGGRASARIEPEHRVFELEIPCAYPSPTRSYARPPRVIFGSAELGAVFGSGLWAQAMGADVRIIGSAVELAEELAKALPDLLFLDVRLPGLRLVEDALHAQRTATRGKPRVVALTRASEPFAMSSALPDEVAPIPISRDRIATVLARF